MDIKLLIRPEFLFLIGVCQALFPYVIWWINGTAEEYKYQTSWIPATVWILGYIAFYIGCGCPVVSFDSRTRARSRISKNGLRIILMAFLFFGILLFIYSIYLYGGIPLLDYFFGLQ
ncbi:MAG: hypothetical protein FJY21_12725, partial [Bacteroidetes bacterium]|nr:hypothetical protein [Bacteroidota bacterium]